MDYITEERDSGSSFAWFLAGAALGAAGAILFAPRPGRETREELLRRAELSRERVDRLREEAAQRGLGYYERGREVYERGRHAAADFTERFRGEQAPESHETAADPPPTPPPAPEKSPSES